MSAKKPMALVILDGWGYREDNANNAINNARTPVMDSLMANNPHTLISASGMDVGLPDGQMGNSEVGHTNIGAGRIVYQDLTRITKAIMDGEFQQNEVLVAAIDKAVAAGQSGSPDGPDVSRWRTLTRRPHLRSSRNGGRTWRRKNLPALLP